MEETDVAELGYGARVQVFAQRLTALLNEMDEAGVNVIPGLPIDQHPEYKVYRMGSRTARLRVVYSRDEDEWVIQ